MRNRIGLAITCLQISAAIYLLIGFGFLFYVALSGDTSTSSIGIAAFMFVANLLIAFGIQVVAKGIQRRRFWAWVTGLCIFGIYTCSLFLPLGALGLWGLLDRGSRREFGITVAREGA